MTSEEKRALAEKLAAELRESNNRLEISRNARTVPDFRKPRISGSYCFVAEGRAPSGPKK